MFRPASCFILAKSGNISNFQGPFTRRRKESSRSIAVPNYKELAVQASPSFTPSLQLRGCAICPFSLLSSVLLARTQIWSPLLSEQMQTSTIWANVLTSKVWGIPASKAAPLLWSMCLFNFPLEKKKKCKTTFLLCHWRIMWPRLSCLMD